MGKSVTDKNPRMTELKRIRIESEISTKDISDYLGLSLNHYVMREGGKRDSKNEEDNEKFFYDTCHAIEELKKRYREYALSIEYNILEESDKIKDLYHAPITEDIYKKVITRLKNKENLIVICTDYLINYEKIEDMLIKDGLEKYTLSGEKEVNMTIREALETDNTVREKFTISDSVNFNEILSSKEL